MVINKVLSRSLPYNYSEVSVDEFGRHAKRLEKKKVKCVVVRSIILHQKPLLLMHVRFASETPIKHACFTSELFVLARGTLSQPFEFAFAGEARC